MVIKYDIPLLPSCPSCSYSVNKRKLLGGLVEEMSDEKKIVFQAFLHLQVVELITYVGINITEFSCSMQTMTKLRSSSKHIKINFKFLSGK